MTALHRVCARACGIPIAALAVIAGCSRLGVSVPQSPLLRYVERKSGFIAVAGLDGNITLMDQAGGDVRSLTKDGQVTEEVSESSTAPFAYHQRPVWSPDGSRIASVRVSGAGQSVQELSIVVVSVKSGDPVTVFSSASQAPSLVAWSPDSTRLVFLASSPSGASYAFTLVPAEGGEPLLLDAGAPYAWAWSPRGQELLVHAGSAAGGLPRQG